MSTVNQSIRILKDVLRTNKGCVEFMREKEDQDLSAHYMRKVDDLTKAIEVLEEYERTVGTRGV